MLFKAVLLFWFGEPDLLNTKTVKFRTQVGIGRFSELEKPFFVQIIVKKTVRMSFLDSETGFLVGL